MERPWQRTPEKFLLDAPQDLPFASCKSDIISSAISTTFLHTIIANIEDHFRSI